jgi:hypothetical protein
MVRNGLAAFVAVFLLGGVGLVLVAFAQPRTAPSVGPAGVGVAAPSPLAKLLSAEAVIVGQVMSIEKEVVEANGTGGGTPATSRFAARAGSSRPAG